MENKEFNEMKERLNKLFEWKAQQDKKINEIAKKLGMQDE